MNTVIKIIIESLMRRGYAKTEAEKFIKVVEGKHDFKQRDNKLNLEVNRIINEREILKKKLAEIEEELVNESDENINNYCKLEEMMGKVYIFKRDLNKLLKDL